MNEKYIFYSCHSFTLYFFNFYLAFCFLLFSVTTLLQLGVFRLVDMVHTVSCTNTGPDKQGLPRNIFDLACEQAQNEGGKNIRRAKRAV